MSSPNKSQLTNAQQRIADEIAKAGADSPKHFTRDEKLGLVANGLMDPKEAGLTTAEEAQLEIMPEAQRTLELGDAVKFEAGVIPLAIRAEWARQELKIVPTDISAWKDQWMLDNKNTHVIQGVMVCGTAQARFERTFSDPILGLSLMLKLAGEMLEKQYLGQEIPPATEGARPNEG